MISCGLDFELRIRPAVRQAIRQAAPNARFVTGSDLLSVGLGLTQYAIRLFGPSDAHAAVTPWKDPRNPDR